MAATEKQLAALKKARAARKKNLAAKKKPVAKKTTVKKKKVAVTAKSRATKKAPSARLKTRRAKNTKPGYYPNPAKKTVIKYGVKVVTNAGKEGYLTEKGAFNTEKDTARAMGKLEAERQARFIFAKYNKKLMMVEVIDIKKPVGAGFKKNPVPASKLRAMKEAVELYEDFTGHKAEHYDEIPVDWMEIGVKVGKCDGVMYETVRDGKTEHYIHKFKKTARPVLAASYDGKQLALIGNKFTFTERGIVDD